MTEDFENEFSDDDGIPTVPDNDMFDEGEMADEELAFDPNLAIGLRSTDGNTKYVPASAPMTLEEAISKSGLFIGGAVQFYLNGAEIKRDTVVPLGAVVAVVGAVKGGSH